jgi:ABC-type amino acid transport substrate-binding protein
MKRLFNIITLLLCAISISAQTIATIDGIIYSLDTGQATIAKQSTTLSGNITIPEKITYNNISYTVSNVANNAFQDTNITGITLSICGSK